MTPLMATLECTVTCPRCGQARVRVMPRDALDLEYTCAFCGTVSRPRARDCCIYCSYGDVPCPQVQDAQRLRHRHA